MFRKALTIFLLLTSPLWLNAAHLKGGYIEYDYVGPSPNLPGYKQFIITVYQYLDCSSAGGQIDDNIIVGTFDAVTNLRFSTDFVPLANTRIIQKKSFDCIDNPPVVCYRIDSYRYTVDLPNNPNGFILCVQRCCRIQGINNVSNSSNTGVTYMVKLFPTLAGDGLLNNSSPVFAQEDTVLVCAKNGFTFPFKATDPNGDSLVYKFTPGLNTPNREAKPNPPLNPPFPDLTYAGIFTAAQPMGPTVKIDPHTGIITGIAPANAGDYVVAVLVQEFRDGVKIAETRKELHLAVGNCNIPGASLPENIVNCNDFVVNFENQSYSAGVNNYYWDFGVLGTDTDISTEARPAFTYPDTGVYRAKLVVNRGGICPDSTETNVRIFPGFVVDFSFKGLCMQVPYQFKDESKTSYGTMNKWSWDFGDPAVNNDSSNAQNPVYRYNAINSYTVRLIASSSKGCEDSISKQIDVSDRPTVDLAFRDTLICSTDTLQLQGLSPGNYSWSPNYNIINPGSSTPFVFPKDTTTYYVAFSNGGCVGTDSVKVNVLDFITVDAGRDTTICLGDAVMLKPVSFATGYTWSPAAFLNNSQVKNPLATVTDSVQKFKILATLGKCNATDSVTIFTEPYPIVNAGTDTVICFGQPAFLHGNSNAARYSWTPANLVENAGSLDTRGFPPSTTAFILTGNNFSACNKPVSDTCLVKVVPRIQVFAGNDTSMVTDQPLQLNGSTSGTTYRWSPATGINNPDILDPIIRIPPSLAANAGNYLRYTLTASVSEGCSASDDILVRFFKSEPSIFVPSSFTPNGDGLNDVLRPVLAGIQTLEYFRVYNRYGNLVYETKQAGAGWNGKIKGQPQQAGSFVYDCRAVDYSGIPVRQSGTFVLIR